MGRWRYFCPECGTYTNDPGNSDPAADECAGHRWRDLRSSDRFTP